MSAESTTPEVGIPLEVAIRLCDEILEESRRRPFAMVAWQCRGCAYRAHGDSAHKGFAEAPGNRGCPMVNQRWEELGRPTT